MSAESIRLLSTPVAERLAPEPVRVEASLLVDALEAARLLGISPRTLWGLTQRGEIKAKRGGRRVLYARAALEEFARR
jgi:excisionase family DNA binding protein